MFNTSDYSFSNLLEKENMVGRPQMSLSSSKSIFLLVGSNCRTFYLLTQVLSLCCQGMQNRRVTSIFCLLPTWLLFCCLDMS